MPFADAQHCRIFYESLGEGPAVVLAHGRGGNAASWFQQVPAFLDAGYRVITFDHRCFGRSYCPPENFDRALFADDLAAVMDAAGVARAAVVCQTRQERARGRQCSQRRAGHEQKGRSTTTQTQGSSS